MSDDALRVLERRYRTTGDVVDHAEWLAARLRAGEVPAARVALAAALGHSAARRILPDRPVVPVCRFVERLADACEEERAARAATEASWVSGAAGAAPVEERLLAYHDTLERALRVLAREVAARCPADDPHVGGLAGALAEWARCPCGTHRWRIRSAREDVQGVTRARTIELLLGGGVAEAEVHGLIGVIDQRVVASAHEAEAQLAASLAELGGPGEDDDDEQDDDLEDEDDLGAPPLPQIGDEWLLEPWAAALGEGWVTELEQRVPELAAALRRVEGGRRLLAALGVSAVVGSLNRVTSEAHELRPVFGCALDAAAALVGEPALREALVGALGPVVLDEGT